MLDDLDFKILEALIDDGRIKFKHLAKALHTDERKISRRINKLVKMGIIKKFTIEIDWKKLGLNMVAYVCTRTTVDEVVRKKLFDFFNEEPRIVHVNSTVGAYEYVLKAMCIDLQDFRERVATPLEPLTAGLSTSVVSGSIKSLNYKPLLRIAYQLRSLNKYSEP
ncbi:MAG: Lrp/AsnC family transcriptional regulator [Nitrososphaerales archaeon]